jgi:predicted transcriptional regulator
MKERVAEIVAAYLRQNSVAPDQLPALIVSVNQALGSLGQAPPPPAIPPTPAVPIRRSIAADKITCLECGYKGLMLKRHLTTAHRLSVADYRTRWNLPSDYPMIAPNYAVRRSEIAKASGLGSRRPGSARRK